MVPAVKFLIVVTAPPYGDPALKLALDLAEAVVGLGHRLSLFLYGDGVYNALSAVSPASDEYDPLAQLKRIAAAADVFYCEAAGLRRGVTAAACHPAFRPAGLGELSGLAAEADRVISL